MDNNTNRSYRIRTKVGDNDGLLKIDMPLVQTYDTFEILSLKLNQKNQYNYYDSNYGVICGRVLANENFGIPNAKISIFIPVEDGADLNERILYNFASVRDTNFDNVRYNLLPDFVDAACHQDVGTFPNKRLVLDNNDIIEIFDKYYKYTTTTNQSGDYMLFGVPTGSQNIHVDIDLSDIGTLSQRPRDMVYKGYNINQFDSPNKFKTSSNLNSLSQIYSQDKGVYCYPYWGNSNNDNENGTSHIAITRCDIQIDYKFEPTAIFMGSIVTDKGANAIGKNCTGTDTLGKMADLSTGEGTIEMIRKTIDNKVEQFQIKGDRLIDGDGVWCYQIPMNLDYVMTDEFGNMVPTDDPSKGIPTRTRVRFRISLDESPDDVPAHKRCRFLVPNNPRYDKETFEEFYKTKEADYEFGSATREESYCDMFWNKVYTVKSYIPRLQKNKNVTNRKHTGIKLINHYGDNNPMPYNNLNVKLSFTFRLICVLVKVLVWIIATINQIFGLIMEPICWISELFLGIAKGLCFSIFGIKPLCWLGKPFELLGNLFGSMIVSGITLNSEFCDDGINKIAFYPVLAKFLLPCVLPKIKKKHSEQYANTTNIEEVEDWRAIDVLSMDNNEFITCVENQLAQDNDATSFLFQNDWINGILYAPLWYRNIRKKKSYFFGLFKRRAKDEWCRSDSSFNLMVFQPCALPKTGSVDKLTGIGVTEGKGKPCGKDNDECHKSVEYQSVNGGLILTRQTMLDETVYYYKAIEYNRLLGNSNGHNSDGVVLLFATDIVLLGSLNDCDINGIPQFFKRLQSTTYKMPTDVLFVDTTIAVNADGTPLIEQDGSINMSRHTEATGADWGNLNEYDECGKMGKATDSGLFYGIGCSTIELEPKSCINLSRMCEYGVSLDMLKEIVDTTNPSDTDIKTEMLIPDGFVSYDEIYDMEGRTMFATLNGNKLKTRLNKKNGLKEYDITFRYIDNFDGLSKQYMRKGDNDCNYSRNYNFETFSNDYYNFRMGDKPYYYDGNNMMLPRYENSFYFYFGLKMGKTAIDKFNSQFFAQCEDMNAMMTPFKLETKPNDWCVEPINEYPNNPCEENNDETNSYGCIKVDISNMSLPCDVILKRLDGIEEEYVISGINYDKFYLGYINGHESGNEEDDGVICRQDVDYYETYLSKYKQDKDFKDDNGQEIIIANGEYELIITDFEGTIVSQIFTISPKILMFNYRVFDNEIPNNQRIEDNNSYTELINKVEQDPKKYGGYIVINYIDNGDDTDKYQYKCTVTTHKEGVLNDYENVTENEGYSCDFVIDEEGKFNIIRESGGTSYKMKIILDPENGTLIILVPKGNIDYDVTITQLCDGIESQNASTVSIRVNDTTPYRLFVNEVDTSAFVYNNGKSWQIGWNGEGKNGNIGNVTDWLDITTTNNYNIHVLQEYEDAKNEIDEILQNLKSMMNRGEEITNLLETYFNEDEISKIKNVINNAIDNLPDTFYDSLQWIKDIEEDFKTKVKETFWLTCSEQPKDIVITVTTKKKPVDYYLLYNEEQSANEGTRYINKLKNGEYEEIDKNVYYVDSIRIPTITNTNDIDYGYDGNDTTKKNGAGVCFGYDNINGKESNGNYKSGDLWFKKPYGIRVTNSEGQKLPLKGNININGEEYFMFHIIDKRLKVDFIAWSYVNNMPYYGNDIDTMGRYIKMMGLIAGDVFNGNPKSITGNITEFDEQTVGEQTLIIQRYNSDEDSMPTKRRFYTVDNDNIYINYKSPVNTINTPYTLLGNSMTELTIKSGDCQLSETVYGNMVVKLNNNYIEGNNRIFEFSINNGDNYENNTYYIINDGVNSYPLRNVRYDGTQFKFNNGNYGIMSYDKTTDSLKSAVDGNFKGTSTNNETEEVIFNDGYGKDNIFRINGIPNKFYVVVETGNKCRTISPLYDYQIVNITIVIATVETVDMDSMSDILNSYSIGIQINNDVYYLRNYDYIIDVLFNLGEQNKIEERIEGKKGELTSFINIDESTYNIIRPYFQNDFMFMFIKDKIELTIKDCTNLILEYDIKGKELKTYCTVSIMLTDEHILDRSGIEENINDASKIYEQGSPFDLFNDFHFDNDSLTGGYIHKGWLINGVEGSLPTVVDKPMVIQPRIVQVQVEFDTNGGTWSDGTTTSVLVGVNTNWKATISKVPVKLLHNFVGWSSDSADVISIDGNTITLSNDTQTEIIKVKAEYSEIEP